MHVLRGNWFWVAYFMILPIFLNLYETVAVVRLSYFVQSPRPAVNSLQCN